MFFEISQNSQEKFTGNSQISSLQLYLKRDSDTGAFLLYRTPPGDCFYKIFLKVIFPTFWFNLAGKTLTLLFEAALKRGKSSSCQIKSENGNIISRTTNLLALDLLLFIGCFDVEGMLIRTVDSSKTVVLNFSGAI